MDSKLENALRSVATGAIGADPNDSPKSAFIGVRVTQALADYLEKQAQSEQVSVPEMARRMLVSGVAIHATAGRRVTLSDVIHALMKLAPG